MKKIFFVFLFCVCCLNSFAQGIAPAIQWQNTIGGIVSEGLWTSFQTNDGGFILGGYSSSNISGDKTENSLGGADYWIVKLDASGNIQWQNTIGANYSDGLQYATQTTDGGYFLAGYSNSGISGDKTEASLNNTYDYWVLKLNSSGNIVWQNTIGGGGSDYIYSAQQTSDGGYIIGGTSDSNISGDKTSNTKGIEDYWIVKLNASGNILWQKDFGGTNSDYLNFVKQTFDKGYFLGGYSQSNISGDKTENNIGGWDYWVLKLDSIGNIQWQKTLGGNKEDVPTCGLQFSDSSYIVGGWSKSGISGNKTEDSIGSGDYWIVKLSSTGFIQWQNTIGGTGGEQLWAMDKTLDGGCVLSGYSVSNISGDKTENVVGGSDYWVIKVNSNGNILWQKDIGGSSWDLAYTVDQANDGSYIVGGVSLSGISGNKTEACIGDFDYWVVKLAPDNACVGCPKPTNLSTLVINHHSAQLNWTTQPCAVAYRIRIRKVGTTTWSSIDVTSNIGFKLLNNLLQANTSYEWQVRTICSIAPLQWSGWTLLQNFTTPLRLEDETKTQTDFILYPNPATNEIKISNLSPEESQIKIFNLLGQPVKSLSVSNEQNHTINISDLPSGIYMLTVSNNKKISGKKFVKE